MTVPRAGAYVTETRGSGEAKGPNTHSVQEGRVLISPRLLATPVSDFTGYEQDIFLGER